MTQNENRTGNARRQGEALETERTSSERMRAVNVVGSAIVHQLNGPLTALQLYIGDLRENCGRCNDATKVSGNMQAMVEAAFQETERVCAMMKSISDTFEQPLHQETAAALGRDAINWWSRSGCVNGGSAGEVVSSALLTPREREVLGYVSQGCSNKQGAIRMQIGSRTFESHRARVMAKLGARNAADLVRMALSEIL
jgi:DNA-binding CsgD family transcriptional regulator